MLHPSVAVNGLALMLAGASAMSLFYWLRWNMRGTLLYIAIVGAVWVWRVAPIIPVMELVWSLSFYVVGIAADMVAIRIMNEATRSSYRQLQLTQRLNAELDARVAERTRDLERAKLAAELANHAKTRFLTHMSHELRTPLNAIIGFSEMMERQILGPIDNPRYRGYATDIRHSGAFLLELVEEILDISRLEQGGYELKEELIAPQPFVDDALRLVAVAAERAGVALVNLATADLPLFRADRRAVRQVLINLLANAIKFTPNAGSITVSASLDAGGGMQFAVTDTGKGIPADRLQAIFEPFHQIDPGTADKRRGVGLGLAIAAALAQAHDGRITVTSRLGGGSTFFIHLPAARVITAVANDDRGPIPPFSPVAVSAKPEG
jgi:two-component system cell cycle sensor histidine kinase PleC